MQQRPYHRKQEKNLRFIRNERMSFRGGKSPDSPHDIEKTVGDRRQSLSIILPGRRIAMRRYENG